MNPYRTVIDLTGRTSEPDETTDSFLKEPDPALPPLSADALPETLQGALRAAGWPDLMPVQSRAMPYILDGRDLIVQSRTGSGKTGAFLLPLLELLDAGDRSAQALVLTPTRELALQVQNEFQTLAQGLPQGNEIESVAVYGGVGYRGQISAFKRGAQLVVGTPGRVLDHLQRKTLDLSKLRVLILDEADEMLSMGFFPDMRKLRRFIPRERRSYMFSATIPFKVRELGREFLHEPGFLSLSEGRVHVDTMAHWYYVVPPMEKDEVLLRLIELQNPDSAIVFCNTKKKVDYLAQVLHNYGYDAKPISGDLRQQAREKVMAQIRSGDLRLLVATDVAARGIDISDLSHVFMYDVPQDPEYYIHRAGRTARAGKTGMALTLATLLDRSSLVSIARRYEIDMERMEPPTDEMVRERVVERAVALLEDALRERSEEHRARFTRWAPVARAVVDAGRPELLALLVDAYYHPRVHGEAPTDTDSGELRQAPESLEAGELIGALDEWLRQKPNLQKRRLNVFVPFVTRMLTPDATHDEDGEPDLIGMLVDDFLTGELDPSATPLSTGMERSEASPPQRGRGKGRGRDRRR